MNTKKEPTTAEFLRLSSRHWHGRLVRIGVFDEEGRATTDYWIACGVPLQELEITEENGRMVFSMKAGEYSHKIFEPRRISFHFSPSGAEDGIDVAETAERTFTVRFENGPLGQINSES